MILMTRRQVLKSLTAAALAAVAPIPALAGHEFPVQILDCSGLVGKTLHCPCCCDDAPAPTDFTVEFLPPDFPRHTLRLVKVDTDDNGAATFHFETVRPGE